MKIALPPDLAADAEVDLGRIPNAYGIAVGMQVRTPGLDRATAQSVLDAAHQVCRYSNATRGNIAVSITPAQACADPRVRPPPDAV